MGAQMNLIHLWKGGGWRRKLFFLWGAVILFELVAGNYSSVRSLFYEGEALTDQFK